MKAHIQRQKTNLQRNSDEENFETEKRSRIPKMPQKTQSLEGKESIANRKMSSSKHKISTTSMIPRPEWKSYSKKSSTPENSEISKVKNSEQDIQDMLQKPMELSFSTKEKQAVDENKMEEEFANFKKNVLKIPEYWTDAGYTVTSVLKNAVDIVKKQYPTADVEAFEVELQNILKATEEVKQQILIKTKDIVHQANQIYNPGFYRDGFKEEGIRAIAKKMEELKEDVNSRKQVFGNLLKCGTGLKQILEMEQLLKLREEALKKFSKGKGKENEKEEALETKKLERGTLKRQKNKMQVEDELKMGLHKKIISPYGDILEKDAKTVIELINNRTVGKYANKLHLEDKSSQTQYLWNNELVGLENSLNNLNKQILELHQMCKDHISKFKSFNLQIKLQGVCNKNQNKEIEILNDEKFQFVEKSSRIQYYNSQNHDLESAIKEKDLEIQQKNRAINKRKKLLHVRDELIEMLRNRCNVDLEDS